jgi:circadian clock protein KaiB
MSTLQLTLYISGRTKVSDRAIATLKRICEEDFAGRYELEVIDILEHPDAAREERIMVTPTLVKKLPAPMRRVIGDLTDRSKVLMGLDLKPAED